MKFSLTAFFLLFAFLFPNKNVQRKIISDSEFNYTFYVFTEGKSKNKGVKYYHWFKSGEIHSSQGSSSGNLLHGQFTKSYKNNNLAEQGTFKNGLKHKIWKRWYKNGQLYEVVRWKNGSKSGNYIQFSENGQPWILGHYKGNRKDGRWINEIANDTVYYKKGIEIEKPKKFSRKPFTQRAKRFIKNLFKKKDSTQVTADKANQSPMVSKKKKRNAKKNNSNKN